MGKNKNWAGLDWTGYRGVAIQKAYIGASRNFIVGKYRKSDVFWGKVQRELAQ